jgi:hypothetical protein
LTSFALAHSLKDEPDDVPTRAYRLRGHHTRLERTLSENVLTEEQLLASREVNEARPIASVRLAALAGEHALA